MLLPLPLPATSMLLLRRRPSSRLRSNVLVNTPPAA
jgi:hypothetical protein